MAEDGWRVATGGRRQARAGRAGDAAAGWPLISSADAEATNAAAVTLAELHLRPRSLACAGPHHGSQAPAFNCSSSSKPPSERQVQQRCAAVDAAAHEVAAAPLWRHLSQQLGALPPHCALPAIRRMVMYGLGSLEQPGAVHIRYQLAAATLLAAALPAAAAPPVAFDPVFTDLDRAVLAHFGIQVGRECFCACFSAALLVSGRLMRLGTALVWVALSPACHACSSIAPPLLHSPLPAARCRRTTRVGGAWPSSPRCFGCRTARRR